MTAALTAPIALGAAVLLAAAALAQRAEASSWPSAAVAAADDAADAWGAGEGPAEEQLSRPHGLSSACRSDLRSYTLCPVKSSLYTICTDRQLLNRSLMQRLLGCAEGPPLGWPERLRSCQERCMKGAGLLLNETTDRPCSADIQAMHGFNDGVDIFTVGAMDSELNVSSSLLLPFPNFKGLSGPSTIRFGDPDKCVQIPSAEYCMLTGKLSLGGGGAAGGGAVEGADGGLGGLGGPPGFSFAIGTCLPKSCNEGQLQALLDGLHGGEGANSSGGGAATAAPAGGGRRRRLGLRVQCGFVRAKGPAEGASRKAQEFLGWGGVPIEHIRRIPVTTGFLLTLGMCGAILALVLGGTALELRREARQRKLRAAAGVVVEEPAVASLAFAAQAAAEPLAPGGPVVGSLSRSRRAWLRAEAFLGHWSLIRNSRSFTRLRPAEQSPFACMDAIRTFSMCQVILGHSFIYPLMSSGLSNMEQFAPPNGLLGSFWFMIVPGCFYGVDTFFLLSGFLCAYGLQRKVFSRSEFWQPAKFSLMYVKFVLMRYLRLLPTELVVIAIVYNLLPALGSGILWTMEKSDGEMCFDGAGRNDCSQLWWTNALFIQNMDQYLGKCMAHTWYLASDMQIYITAPFFSLCYGINRRVGWSVLGLGLAVGITLPMILMAHYDWVPDMILGARAGYAQKFYMKPWCRMSPFLIGMALAWLWDERLSSLKGRPVAVLGQLRSFALALLGLGLCFVATFARAFMYQCDLTTCMSASNNPAGKLFMYLWAGFSIPIWSVGLSIIMVLCFQDRFLPLFQGFLHQPFWQPLAKLSYSAYLIHTSILILNFCQRDSPLTYGASTHFYSFVSFVVLSLGAAYVLYLLVEKPLANLQAKVLGGGSE